VSPRLADPVRPDATTLTDAQFVLAREHGFESWAKLKHHIEERDRPRVEQYESVAKDLLGACQGDAAALQRLHDLFGNSFTRSGRPFTTDQLRAKVRERLSAIPGATTPTGDLTLPDAQLLVARQYGFENWVNLVASMAQPRDDPRSVPHGSSSTPPFYRINWKQNTIEPGVLVSDKDWDTVFALM
jgi:hypothetical protein